MPTSNAEIIAFLSDFKSHSQKQKDSLIPIWGESLSNYLVLPPEQIQLDRDPAYPTRDGRNLLRGEAGYLKDPETKQVIDTLHAKFMLALFGESYIAAMKRGREDASEAETVTRLLRYVFGLEGHYRVMHTGILDLLLFGTGIVKGGWELIERLKTFRDIEVIGGEEFKEETRMVVPVFDDVRLRNVDLMDFFPDPGHDQLRDMVGCAETFRINAYDALRKAKKGQYSPEAVKLAIANAAASQDRQKNGKQPAWRRDRIQPDTTHPAFKELQGTEYWGEVPWAESDGERWRLITTLNGQVVRNKPWPLDDYRLPFFDLTLSPIAGRFWGLGAAEGARYQQDFLDFLMMITAEAVTRSVKPPIIHNLDDDLDPQQLANWSPDVPIASQKPGDIRTLPYSANIQGGFALFNQIKQSIRENTGALGSVQGLGLGINRASATEAERTFTQALSRPELAVAYLEKECLPPLGKFILNLYQMNLETTEELVERIGEQPTPVRLADINGDFDVIFVGSRKYKSLEVRMASVDRLLQLSQIPQLANRIPWDTLGVDILEMLGFDKLVEELSDPMTVVKNLMIQNMNSNGGLFSNGNNQLPGAQPDLPEAQLAGRGQLVE